MASWLVVWLVIGTVSTLAILACLLGLVRHVLILGRTIKHLQQELQPITNDLSREAARAGEHVGTIGDRGKPGASAAPGKSPGQNPAQNPRVNPR